MNIVNIILYRELGENLADEELRAMIDEFDKDGDGESKSLFWLLSRYMYYLQMIKFFVFFFNS